jgi:hypothetical protein
MSKVYLFLKKLLALALNALVFGVLTYYKIPWYFSSPILVLIFSLICSRILVEIPKELYNFTRSEKFFSKGGLRDLIRIPVVLFAFIHDVVVWKIWGVYQIFLMAVDLLYFIKVLIFQLLHAIIWFVLLLVPFWRILINFLFFYFIKWPWWIYRYAYKALLKTFNRNVLRISLWGSLITLLTLQFFYFLDIVLGLTGLRYVGCILALLPVSWIFGEISALRGQKLMNASYDEIKLKFRNGLETVRGILFFLTFFVVLLLAQAGLNLLGWIPKSGIILLGIGININLIINIILIFLSVVITFGTIVLPTYRLYNEFSETSIKNTTQLLSYIGKRLAQILSGLVPASFFSVISILPVSIIVIIALTATLRLKNNIIEVKIEKILKEQQVSVNQNDEYKLTQHIIELQYIQQFPMGLLQEMKHRPFFKEEFESDKRKLSDKKVELAKSKDLISKQLSNLEKQIEQEKQRVPVINQTRIEELTDSVANYKFSLINTEKTLTIEIQNLATEVEFAARKHNQLPLIFYLSGLFLVVCSTFIFIFFFGYFGNFFYSAFVFRNDNQPAQWKELIDAERKLDSKQPLLSTTLNFIIIVLISCAIFYNSIGTAFVNFLLF